MPKVVKSKSRNEPAVTILPGRLPLSRAVEAQQFGFVMDAGPYYRLAFRNGEKKQFLIGLFEIWFKMWPEIPANKGDLDFAIHRQQVTRHYVQNELHFSGSFSNKACDKTWEEYLTQKADEFAEMKEKKALEEAHIRPRPRPIPKTPHSTPVATATNTNQHTRMIPAQIVDQSTLNAARILVSLNPNKRKLVPRPIRTPNYIVVDDNSDGNVPNLKSKDVEKAPAKGYIVLDDSDDETGVPLMHMSKKSPVKYTTGLRSLAPAASSSKGKEITADVV